MSTHIALFCFEPKKKQMFHESLIEWAVGAGFSVTQATASVHTLLAVLAIFMTGCVLALGVLSTQKFLSAVVLPTVAFALRVVSSVIGYVLGKLVALAVVLALVSVAALAVYYKLRGEFDSLAEESAALRQHMSWLPVIFDKYKLF